MSARVVGIGGIFFTAREPERLREWYRSHLGLAIGDWGGVYFDGRAASEGGRQAGTVWSVFPERTEYFLPSAAPFMINYRAATGIIGADATPSAVLDPAPRSV